MSLTSLILSSGLYRRYRNFTDSAFVKKGRRLYCRWRISLRPETDYNFIIFIKINLSIVFGIFLLIACGFSQYKAVREHIDALVGYSAAHIVYQLFHH